MSSFSVSEIPQGSACVLICQGRLDNNASGMLEARIAPILAQGTKHLIVDLAAVDYLSSAGVRSLLVTLKKVSLAKGTMALCGTTPGVLQVLELSGFRGILKNYPDRHTAMPAA